MRESSAIRSSIVGLSSGLNCQHCLHTAHNCFSMVFQVSKVGGTFGCCFVMIALITPRSWCMYANGESIVSISCMTIRSSISQVPELSEENLRGQSSRMTRHLSLLYRVYNPYHHLWLAARRPSNVMCCNDLELCVGFSWLVVLRGQNRSICQHHRQILLRLPVEIVRLCIISSCRLRKLLTLFRSEWITAIRCKYSTPQAMPSVWSSLWRQSWFVRPK